MSARPSFIPAPSNEDERSEAEPPAPSTWSLVHTLLAPKSFLASLSQEQIDDFVSLGGADISGGE